MTFFTARAIRAASALAAFTISSAAVAADWDAIDKEIEKAKTVGPAKVALANQAMLTLPADMIFVPRPTADKVMEAMGNQVGDAFQGLVFPTHEPKDWFVSVKYVASGYVRDGDAREWKADELLTSLKDGTEQANEWRRSQHMPEMIVTGWVEAPRYNGANNTLVWSAGTRDKSSASDAAAGVNYNTYVLGREGYMSLNMITKIDSIGAEKSIADGLIADVSFNDGKRYADFREGTDKVAAYGLAALIGGIAAKKIGLLAIIGVWLVKGWKLLALTLAGAATAFKKFFRRDAAPAK